MARCNPTLPAYGLYVRMDHYVSIGRRSADSFRESDFTCAALELCNAGNLFCSTAATVLDGAIDLFASVLCCWNCRVAGAGNVMLHGVGAGYGVLKLVADPLHWSDDGH